MLPSLRSEVYLRHAEWQLGDGRLSQMTGGLVEGSGFERGGSALINTIRQGLKLSDSIM